MININVYHNFEKLSVVVSMSTGSLDEDDVAFLT